MVSLQESSEPLDTLQISVTVIFLAIIPNDVLLDYMWVGDCVHLWDGGGGGGGGTGVEYVVFTLTSVVQGMGLCVYIFVSSLRLLTQSSCQC